MTPQCRTKPSPQPSAAAAASTSSTGTTSAISKESPGDSPGPNPGPGNSSSRPGLIEGLERKLYCYCRQPTSKDLIGCDHCPEWYHPDCLQLSPASVRTILQLPSWRCPECQARQDEVKLRHRQLQLPIPRGGQFCEVKTCRLESWGLQDYQDQGWVPVTNNTWRTLDQADTTTVTSTETNTGRRKRKGTIPFDPEQYERLSKMSRIAAAAGSERGNKESLLEEPEPLPANTNGQQDDEQSERSPKTTATVIRGRNKNNKQTKTAYPDLTQREEDNFETENITGNGDTNDKFPRMRLFQQNESSKNTNSTEEEDSDDLEIQPYDELFFCYVCKSIFVSKQALENHHSQDHNC